MFPGEVLEFGVYQGTTIDVLAESVAPQVAWGFDSFQGLPERWERSPCQGRKLNAGHFAVDSLPEVAYNVTLQVGWFEDTIPVWRQQHPDSRIALLHVDSDLYSSARTVLMELDAHIQTGTIIVFDEIYNWDQPERYVNWADHEYKALVEWMDHGNRLIRPISRTRFEQLAIEVLR